MWALYKLAGGLAPIPEPDARIAPRGIFSCSTRTPARSSCTPFEVSAVPVVRRYGLMLLAALAGLCCTTASARGDEPVDPRDPTVWALVVVGLPGDEEHRQAFTETSAAWRRWLSEQRQVPAGQLIVLTAATRSNDSAETRGDERPADERQEPAMELPASKESLRSTFSRLEQQIGPQDALWVFVLGHGNYDRDRAFLHVSGPDPSDLDLAGYLEKIVCREQVVWLTHSCSGWFVARMSRPNRTEFPMALAAVMARSPMELDQNADGQVSVLELFAAAVQETDRRFAADQRLPTEHAQLDDDGDGRGSELSVLLAPPKSANSAGQNPPSATTAAAAPEKRDGRLAAATFVLRSMPVRDSGNPSTDSKPDENP
jgi:hypothetical protein